MLNVEKLTAMATYFLSRAPKREIQNIKLMKLLYIAERYHLRENYTTISSVSFASLEHGPVISDGLEVMDGSKPDRFWNDHVEFLAIPSRWRLKGDEVDPKDYLSGTELKTLQKVFVTYAHRSQQDLRAHTHTFKEWDERAEKLQTSFPIELEAILTDGLKLEPELANGVIDELKFYHALSA